MYLLVFVPRDGGILSLYLVVVVNIFGGYCHYQWLLSLSVVIVTIGGYCHYR